MIKQKLLFFFNRHKYYLLLISTVLCFNWFFTLQQVSLKDDNSFYYMPVRMYLSDALHQHTLPYWNPYIMNGVPQYADMQSAFWNPIALILCFLFKYNHTLFLLEYIIYLCFAAIGSFKLFGLITTNNIYKYAAACIYISCGFTSGVANFINWTASIGFIPWIFFYFFSILKNPNHTNALLLGIFVWLLFVCGYPAFLIYSLYCLGIIAIVLLFYYYKHTLLKKYVYHLLAATLVTLILSYSPLLAYVEFLPFYNRGSQLKTGIDLAFRDCFYPQFLSSLFIPTSVYRKDYDVLCHSANRDLYFGIIPLLFAVLSFTYFNKQKLTPVYKILLGILLFSAVFIFGYLTPLGNFVYQYFPLMGSFKWSALARIFIILIVLAFAIKYVNNYNYNLTVFQSSLIKVIGVLFITGIIITLFVTLQYADLETEIHKNIIIANAVFQLVLWLSIILFTRTIFTKKKWLLIFVILDAFVNYNLAMAITGVANVKPAVFNKYCKAFYNQQPHGYLKQPLAANRKYYMFNPWINHNASKIMNGATFLESNTVFSGYEKMFIDDTANERILRNNPFIFSEDIPEITIDSVFLSYKKIYVSFTANQKGNVILQQNNYYKWQEKYYHSINTWHNCFMQLPAKAGRNTFTLEYNTSYIKKLFVLQWILIIIVMTLLLNSFYKILPTQR